MESRVRLYILDSRQSIEVLGAMLFAGNNYNSDTNNNNNNNNLNFNFLII